MGPDELISSTPSFPAGTGNRTINNILGFCCYVCAATITVNYYAQPKSTSRRGGTILVSNIWIKARKGERAGEDEAEDCRRDISSEVVHHILTTEEMTLYHKGM
jgi:hypothetical protein